ncbi:MAG: flavin reductase family protein [Chloroflexi bacterium]|nr:flavin reductase family protein [Chloroflexota bacterium]
MRVNKVTKGPQTWLYPLPALLIGTVIGGKPNFMTAAWGSIANAEPPMLSVAIRRSRHTRSGIEPGGTFSVNIPSVSQAREVDYCGIESGSKTDKVERCGFTVFYGELETAPLIEQCPVNLECVVKHILELGTHSLVVADIKQTHISEDCLTDGTLDVTKVDPLIYLTSPMRKYVHAGVPVGGAFSLGRGL